MYHIMKKNILLIVALTLAGITDAQELQGKFKVFSNLCFECRNAYWNKDADKLSDCVMRMYEMTQDQNEGLLPCTRLVPCEPYDSTKYENHLLFDVDWMDKIVADWTASDSTLIDVSSAMRGQGLLHVNFLIPANSTQKFTTKGRGLMTIMVIAEDETDIGLCIDHESCNHHYASLEKAEKGCQYNVWQANSRSMTPLSISVTNPSNHDVVCVFVTD